MSIRTIIEINHDYLDDVSMRGKSWAKLLQNLKGQDITEKLNNGMVYVPFRGIRVLAQKRHSDRMKLEIE